MAGLLQRELPRPVRILLPLLILLLPVLHVLSQYDRDTGFTALILFGPAFEARALDEVRAIPHPRVGQVGYDGQFYAQLAIDPTLRHPQLATALDNPRYRSVRILLPALANGLGLGRPAWILNAYALLNPAFLVLFLWTFVYFLRPRTPAQFLCLTAAALSTGVLASIARSLTDLPSSALAFLAAALAGSAASFPIFAAALLCREATVVSIFAVLWPRQWTPKEFLRLAGGALVALLPLVVWVFYVDRVFGDAGTPTPGSVGTPLIALWIHLRSAAAVLIRAPGLPALFHLLTTLSLLVQAVYLFAKPRLSSPYWRMGIGFAVLLFFFRSPLYAEPLATTRALLPLTFAFNALLADGSEKHFLPWFVAGNAGLAFGALQMLRALAGA
jgi:hypothetical protein